MSKFKKIFVTGADGFIGSHLCEQLVKKNYKVIALAQYNSFGRNGWLDTLDNETKNKLKIISGDIRDKQFLAACTKKIDILFNLAALIGIPYSYKSVESYIDTNIKGTLNVLNVSKENNIKKLIHISTSEVYGSAQKIPIDEKHPVVGQSPYSASKIAAEQLCISYNKSFNLPVTILRPFNVFGPRQSTRAIIPTIISQCMKKPKSLSLGVISTTRDFNYIDDTVDALIKTIDAKNISGETINIGSGKEFSIKSIIEIISEYFEIQIKVKKNKFRMRPENSEVLRLCSSTNKSKKLLKWKSSIKNKNDLKKKINKTINWYIKNINFMEINPKKYSI